MADPVQYPRWRYHATKPATLVQNDKEEKALGAGWVDNPGQARPSKAEPTPQEQIAAAAAQESRAAADKAVTDAKAKAEADAKAAAAKPPAK